MRIIVTGAAGLIGGEVCSRLCQRGHQVTALVHRNRNVLGNDGAPAPVADVVSCNLSDPGIGVSASQFDRLRANHDLVIHCAALTRFDLEPGAYRDTNIDGTARMIALAHEGSMAFLHISTAYVGGQHGGLVTEEEPAPTTGFTNAYEASKAEAERLVRSSGLCHAIARPGIVVGDSKTGRIRCFDTIYAVFRLIAQGRIRYLPVTPGATLSFVPIDHVALGIVSLAERMAAANNRTFHLVCEKPLPIERFAEVIGSFPGLSAPILLDAQKFECANLPEAERRLYRRTAALYAAYFQQNPSFESKNLRQLTGIAPPSMDKVTVRQLIAYCIEGGLIVPTVQRTSG